MLLSSQDIFNHEVNLLYFQPVMLSMNISAHERGISIMFSFPLLIAALGAVSKMSHASLDIVQQISPAANTCSTHFKWQGSQQTMTQWVK